MPRFSLKQPGWSEKLHKAVADWLIMLRSDFRVITYMCFSCTDVESGLFLPAFFYFVG